LRLKKPARRAGFFMGMMQLPIPLPTKSIHHKACHILTHVDEGVKAAKVVSE